MILIQIGDFTSLSVGLFAIQTANGYLIQEILRVTFKHV